MRQDATRCDKMRQDEKNETRFYKVAQDDTRCDMMRQNETK